MKPVSFEYERPDSLDAAIALLTEAGADGRIIAGGQSLGPMLNLRLAQPGILVDVRSIAELQRVDERDGGVEIGACVTHAAIEDGALPDVTNGALTQVAGGIAYRAVRNRGTIGGSLAHADPAADWVTALTALRAEVLIAGPSGERRQPLSGFVTAAFETGLGTGDILRGIHVPALAASAQWGFYKFCRKAGDFADAMAAVFHDPESGDGRSVVGATHGQPIIVEGIYDADKIQQAVDGAGFDAYDRQTHLVAAKRAAMIAGLA